jgi:hypothetical protein
MYAWNNIGPIIYALTAVLVIIHLIKCIKKGDFNHLSKKLLLFAVVFYFINRFS